MTDEVPREDVTPSVEEIIALNRANEIFPSDTGNGMRFCNLHKNVAKYVVDRDEWIVWTGTHWEPDPGALTTLGLTSDVVRQIRADALAASDEPAEGGVSPRERWLRWATATEQVKARMRMIECTREWPEMVVRSEDELDADPDHLVCPNGTIDLRSGELISSTPRHLNTRCCAVDYDPDATSPLLDQFFETFMPDPADQEIMFAVLGTCLRGYNLQRIFPFFIGGTTSGKTQLLAAIRRVFGPYTCGINASVFRGNLDDKPRPDLVRAMFTRLAYAVEASKIWELHADQIKRLTGGVDVISYRQLHSRTVEHVPRFTPLIVANEMPRVKGADAALKRRMIVIRFDKTIPVDQEDTTVKTRFINDTRCLQAILARTVVGAQSPLIRDGIKWDKIPRHFALATLESFGALDHVDEFLAWMGESGYLIEATEETPTSHMAKASELHRWYKSWIREHGNAVDMRESLSMSELNSSLRERGWESKLSAGTRWMGKRLATPGLPT